MDELLRNSLINKGDDLNDIRRIREYLDSQAASSESYSITWRTIEAFNSVLTACTSRDIPDAQALGALLDNFYCLARNNHDDSSWSHFGFELGVICVKILSAIEQTDMFEVFFYKLLTVINKICERNSDIWKAVARQILNVLINKKFSFVHKEIFLKQYISILRNVESSILYNFADKNSHLLKTFSEFVQHSGDFEMQMDILESVFLHISNDKSMIRNFFVQLRGETKELFQRLQFIDFEGDCRTFLNSLNKSLGESERKVFSFCCSRLYLGGVFLEPPDGRKSIWIDLNKSSKRISFRCFNFLEEGDTPSQCVIHIQFMDTISVGVDHEKEINCIRITIKTQNLKKIYDKVKNDEILCLGSESDNHQESVLEFENALKEMIGKGEEKKKEFQRMSQTCDSLVIDRNVLSEESAMRRFPLQNWASGDNFQDNSIPTHRMTTGISRIIPNALSLFDRVENKSPMGVPQKQNDGMASAEKLPDIFTRETEVRKLPSNKSLQTYTSHTEEFQSPVRNDNIPNIVLETQELTPNSFVESLNKNLGLDSPDVRQSFESSLEKAGLTQAWHTSPARKSHKLFRSPEKIFQFLDDNIVSPRDNPLFEKSSNNKENEPPNEFKLPRESVKKSRKVTAVRKKEKTNTRVLRERRNIEIKTFDSQSEEYFRKEDSMMRKKPTLPKLRSSCRLKKSSDESDMIKKVEKPRKLSKTKPKEKQEARTNDRKPRQSEAPQPRSSLLDPNGYSYRRWQQPTTSERSNFWLKKLNSLEKHKTESTDVFDFSDESADEVSKPIKRGKPKKKANSRKPRKNWKKEDSAKRRPPLSQIKDIIKSCSYSKSRDVSESHTIEKTESGGEKMKVITIRSPGNRKPITRSQDTKSNKEVDRNKIQNENFSDYSIQDFSDKDEAGAPVREREVSTEKCEKSPERDSMSDAFLVNYDTLVRRRSTTDDEDEGNGNFDLPEIKLRNNEEPEEIIEESEDLEGNKTELEKNEDYDVEVELENKEEPQEILNEPEENFLDLSEDENLAKGSQKRERSDDENSLTKTLIKKKIKIKRTSPAAPSALQRRLQKREEKARRETDEIIQTVQKALSQLTNQIHLKERKEIACYLNAAEESMSGLKDSDDCEVRSKRLKRLREYFKAGCSVSPMCEAMDAHFSRIQVALRDLTGNATDNSKKITRFNNRLKSLIHSEIERFIEMDFASVSKRLRRFASAFGDELGSSEFSGIGY